MPKINSDFCPSLEALDPRGIGFILQLQEITLNRFSFLGGFELKTCPKISCGFGLYCVGVDFGPRLKKVDRSCHFENYLEFFRRLSDPGGFFVWIGTTPMLIFSSPINLRSRAGQFSRSYEGVKGNRIVKSNYIVHSLL